MRALPEPTGPRFLKVGTQMLKAVCLTRIEHWYAHFDARIRMPVRCGGEGCQYCDAGRVPELRFVVGIREKRIGRALLELRERHRGLVEELNNHESEGVGCKLTIYRTGTAMNSPINVELEGWEVADEWDIGRLVESLGFSHPGRIPQSDEVAMTENHELNEALNPDTRTRAEGQTNTPVPVHESRNTKALVPSGTDQAL